MHVLFDMIFTFVYTGWEGTANDSSVFMDALNRPKSGFPLPEEGKNIDIYIYMCVCVCVNMFGFYFLIKLCFIVSIF